MALLYLYLIYTVFSITLLTGLQVFYCETNPGFEEPGEENEGNVLYRAVAEGLRELRVLRVYSMDSMSLPCWVSRESLFDFLCATKHASHE